MNLERMLNKCDRIYVQKIPPDTPAGTTLNINLSGVQGKILNGSGIALTLPFQQPGQKKKERFSVLQIDFDEKYFFDEIEINLTTAKIRCTGRINSPIVTSNFVLTGGRSTLTTFYRRKNKDKILHAYFGLTGGHFLGIDSALSKYDLVFCVDTNCGTGASGEKVSVTSAIIGRPMNIADSAISLGDVIDYQCVAPMPSGNPEIEGIWRCFAHVYKENPHLLGKKTALITDTEYSLIKSWQSRDLSFFDGYMLPDGIDIFYATSDAGSDEFFVNRLIKTCDQRNDAKIGSVK